VLSVGPEAPDEAVVSTRRRFEESLRW
jgi:hypothetical protein